MDGPTDPARPAPAAPVPIPPLATALARRARPLGGLVAMIDAERRVRLIGDPDVTWPDHPGLATAVREGLTSDPARMSEPLVVREGLHLLPLAPTDDRRGLMAAVILDAASSDGIVRSALEGVTPSYRRVKRRSVGEVRDLHSVFLGLHADLERRGVVEAANDDLRRQLSFSFEQLMTLYGVGRMVSTATDPRVFVERSLAKLSEIFDFQWYAVQYVQQHAATGSVPRGCVVHGEPPMSSRALQSILARHLQDPDAADVAGILIPGRSPLARDLGGDVIVAPVRRDGTPIGCMVAGSKQGADRDPTSIESQLIGAVTDFLGVFHQNLERLRAQQSLTTGTVRALTSAIDAKDPYTRGHSERVGLLTRQLSEAMGFDQATIGESHLAGLLHDVGKIGVPEAVLRKPGRLTDEEFQWVRQHPVIGHGILRDIEPLARVLPGVLHHHERIDGGGYPHGIAGEEIPLIARIIAVADGFDAMSSNRAYRSGMPRERVLGILAEGRGTQWDPAIVDRFLALDLTVYDAMIDDHRQQQGVFDAPPSDEEPGAARAA